MQKETRQAVNKLTQLSSPFHLLKEFTSKTIKVQSLKSNLLVIEVKAVGFNFTLISFSLFFAQPAPAAARAAGCHTPWP